MRHDRRETIVDAAKRWIRLMPGGLVFRTKDVQRHVLGTQVIACQGRGHTPSGRPRFHTDVMAAIRSLQKERVVKKLGQKWQRTSVE